MDVDATFNHIGQFGREQQKYTMMLSVLRMSQAANLYSFAFVGKEMKFTCLGRDGSNLNMKSYVNECPNNEASRCEQLTFHNIQDESSIMSEFSLVCDRHHLLHLTMTLYLLGLAVGQFVMGHFSDKHGRKFCAFLSLLISIASNSIGLFYSNYYIHCALRTINGFSFGGSAISMVVLNNELTGSSGRGLAAAIFSTGFAFGVFFLSIASYLLPHWEDLVFGIDVIAAPLLVCFIWIPESPRWLISKRRSTEANKVLESIAKGNGVPWKSEYAVSNSSIKRNSYGQIQEHAETLPIPSISQFLNHRKLLAVFITLTFGWFTLFLVYTGLTLAAGKDGDNLHFGTALSGIVEIPGDYFGSVIMAHFGRRRTIGTLLLSCGVSLFFTSLIPVSSSLLLLVFITFGKMTVSSGFALFSVFTSELLPTNIRSSAFGIITTVARLLNSICPYLILLGSFVHNLHYLIFGFLAFATGGLILWALPETDGRPLPQDIGELLQML